MTILYLIIFFTPALLAVNYHYKLQKKVPSKKAFIHCLIIYSWVILWLNVLVLYKRGWYEFDFTRLSIQFLLKYFTLSTFWSYFLPYMYRLIDWFIGRFITGKYHPKF